MNDTQYARETVLFNTVEKLLHEKYSAHAWNPSTTADEIVDAVVAQGWVFEADVQAWLAENVSEETAYAFADAFPVPVSSSTGGEQ